MSNSRANRQGQPVSSKIATCSTGCALGYVADRDSCGRERIQTCRQTFSTVSLIAWGFLSGKRDSPAGAAIRAAIA